MELRSIFSKIISIFFYIFALLLLLALISYTKVDADILAINFKVTNLCGPFGAWISDFLRSAFGFSSFLSTLLFILAGLYFSSIISNDYYFQTSFAVLILFFTFSIFLGLVLPYKEVQFSGGYIGHYLSEFFIKLAGYNITLFITVLINGITIFNSGLFSLINKILQNNKSSHKSKPVADHSSYSIPLVSVLDSTNQKKPVKSKKPWITKKPVTTKTTIQNSDNETIKIQNTEFEPENIENPVSKNSSENISQSKTTINPESSGASHYFDQLLDNDPDFNISINETKIENPHDTIFMKDLLFEKRVKSSYFSDAISKNDQNTIDNSINDNNLVIETDDTSQKTEDDILNNSSSTIKFTSIENSSPIAEAITRKEETPVPATNQRTSVSDQDPLVVENNYSSQPEEDNNINETQDTIEDNKQFTEPEIDNKDFNEDHIDEEHLKKEEEIQSVISEAAKLSSKAKLGNNDSSEEERVFHTFAADEDYSVPSYFFKQSENTDPAIWNREIERNSELLVKTLNDFGIESKVSEVHRGPVITLYEVQIAAGIKVNKVSSLSDDIAMALAASRVRIVAPIPGKSAVGVEIPNKTREMVTIGDIFDAKDYRAADMQLKVGLGKDILGKVVKLDLKKQPHLLIAGATGAGKSVCVNTLISSLVFNYDPNRVRFIMVDPKMVELQLYNGLPHQLTPVITEPDIAPKALKWAIYEMERRYRLLSDLHVRDIERYNQKINSYNGQSDLEPLPYIVIIVDELADLMMVAPKEMENYITRIAQKARAVGIHLVLATQRPSVDVITGIIKANFPARIAFQVAQKTDSRTIIDQNGAETLLGKGDMLYQSPMSSFPKRIQGAFISEDEIIDMVRHAQKFGHPHYIDIESEVDERESTEISESDVEQDEVFVEALRIIEESRKASASYLQRRLSIGYNRAARIIERMEELGYVGPPQGSKPREVLI